MFNVNDYLRNILRTNHVEFGWITYKTKTYGARTCFFMRKFNFNLVKICMSLCIIKVGPSALRHSYKRFKLNFVCVLYDNWILHPSYFSQNNWLLCIRTFILSKQFYICLIEIRMNVPIARAYWLSICVKFKMVVICTITNVLIFVFYQKCNMLPIFDFMSYNTILIYVLFNFIESKFNRFFFQSRCVLIKGIIKM